MMGILGHHLIVLPEQGAGIATPYVQFWISQFAVNFMANFYDW